MVYADGLGIRSHKPSLDSVSAVIKELRGTDDPSEAARLVLMAAILIGDAECLCTETGVTLGEESEEAIACRTDVGGKVREVINEVETIFKEKFK